MASFPSQRKILSQVHFRLKEEYRSPRLNNPYDPLEDLVFLMLSPRTRSEQHIKSFKNIKKLCPDFYQIPVFKQAVLRDCVADAGLSAQKISRITAVINEINNRQIDFSLDHLKLQDNHSVEKLLRSLPGVGVKIARCVMLYTLGRAGVSS